MNSIGGLPETTSKHIEMNASDHHHRKAVAGKGLKGTGVVLAAHFESSLRAKHSIASALPIDLPRIVLPPERFGNGV